MAIDSGSVLGIVVPIAKNNNLVPLRTLLSKSINLPVQIVIVHDVQDDSTGPALKLLVNEFREIKIELVEGIFGNPGSARNKGSTLLDAPWVTFWDSDDFPSPRECIELINEFENTEPEVLIASFEVQDLNNVSKVKKRMLLNEKSSLLDVAVNVGIWRFIFKREIIQGIDFPPIRMGEDIVFIAQLNLPDKRYIMSNRITYCYVQGSLGQLTNEASAVREMSKSLTLLGSLYRSSTGLNKEFVLQLFIRQFFSALMRRVLPMSLKTFLVNWHMILSHPKNLLKVICKTLIRRGRK